MGPGRGDSRRVESLQGAAVSCAWKCLPVPPPGFSCQSPRAPTLKAIMEGTAHALCLPYLVALHMVLTTSDI